MLGMPNIKHSRQSVVPVGVRETALVAHGLPHAEISVRLDDGRAFGVSGRIDSLMTPCAFRRAIVAHGHGRLDSTWVAHIAGTTFISPRCHHVGGGVFAAVADGASMYAFTSELDPRLLCAAIEGLPESSVSARVIVDSELDLSLVALEVEGPVIDAEYLEIVREVQATVLVTEIEQRLRQGS
jgi:hypothetical protein